MAVPPKPKPPKFGYTSKKQVKITKPKPPKFGYTSKSQVKITKPAKPKHESLTSIARSALFEAQADKLSVINPKTKNRIKVLSALKYPHDHPAFKAAAALLKKKNITLPANVHAVKPGEQIPLFNLKPYEDPKRAAVGRAGSAISGDGAEEYLTEKQEEYLRQLGSSAKEGIDTYTGSGYTWMNAYLRGDADRAYEMLAQEYGEEDSEEDMSEYADSRINDAIYGLDNAFEGEGAILKDDVLSWRGVSRDSGILEDVLDGGVGTVIQDSGFISTSVHDRVAKNFAGQHGTILKIIARKGTKGLYPQAAGMGHSDEFELILNRDSKLRVIEIGTEKVKTGYGDEMTERHVITCETILEGEEK